jgi:hypothetical protein
MFIKRLCNLFYYFVMAFKGVAGDRFEGTEEAIPLSSGAKTESTSSGAAFVVEAEELLLSADAGDDRVPRVTITPCGRGWCITLCAEGLRPVEVKRRAFWSGKNFLPSTITMPGLGTGAMGFSAGLD